MARAKSSTTGNGAHYVHTSAPTTDTREPTPRPPRNMAAVTAQLRMSAELVHRNIFTGAIEYCRPGQQWRPLGDADLRSLTERLQNDGLPETGLWTVRDAVALLADEQLHHPVRDDVLGQLPLWDGTERCRRWFTEYLPCELPPAVLPVDPELMPPREAAVEYYEILGRRWLVSCVARILHPGCVVDLVPVLTGDMIALTKAIEMLVPHPWLRQLTSLPPDVSPDEGAQRLLGAWVHILPPLPHDQRDLRKLKAFLSATSDRPQRGTLLDRALRQCAFIALREESDLIDETGTALFWPAIVDSARIDLRAIKRDQAQLWAESVAAWRCGETWLRPWRMNLLARQGQTNVADDDLSICHSIEVWLAARPDPVPFSLRELMKGIWGSNDFDVDFDVGKAVEMNLARVLKKHFGYHKDRCWERPRRGDRLWSRKGVVRLGARP
jgi:hypothetical protein